MLSHSSPETLSNFRFFFFFICGNVWSRLSWCDSCPCWSLPLSMLGGSLHMGGKHKKFRSLKFSKKNLSSQFFAYVWKSEKINDITHFLIANSTIKADEVNQISYYKCDCKYPPWDFKTETQLRIHHSMRH